MTMAAFRALKSVAQGDRIGRHDQQVGGVPKRDVLVEALRPHLA
ncbi:hypothetical protein [Kutzneria sp. CA-103260]|nr:hypothetical protein [Kutzneria sp. CA-103260]QUQ70308.1 hypothetical protein JJ691_80830 [Kutzneria sp. CA-103260]